MREGGPNRYDCTMQFKLSTAPRNSTVLFIRKLRIKSYKGTLSISRNSKKPIKNADFILCLVSSRVR